MTVALLDQQYDWSERVTTASPAAALRAASNHRRRRVGGCQHAGSKRQSRATGARAVRLRARARRHGVDLAVRSEPSPVGSALRCVRRLRPPTPTALAALEQATPVSDDIFDARRSPAHRRLATWHAGNDVLVLRARQSHRRWSGVGRRYTLDGRLVGDVDRRSQPMCRRQDRGRGCRWRRSRCSPRSRRGLPPLPRNRRRPSLRSRATKSPSGRVIPAQR